MHRIPAQPLILLFADLICSAKDQPQHELKALLCGMERLEAARDTKVQMTS